MTNIRLSCKSLFISWSLAVIGLWLMTSYGHIGLLLALVPLAIAQNMRLEHDRAMYQRIRESKGWMGFAMLYYVLLLVVVVLSLARGTRLEDLPFVYFVILIMFPIFVAMIANDLRICKRPK